MTSPPSDPSGDAAEGPVERGMRALLARREAALAAGSTALGWKIGFNAPSVQAHFGLHSPVVGYLLDSAVVGDGATVSVGSWTAPAVEVEVAVRVGDGGRVAGLAPALELVDLDLPSDDIEPILAGNIFQRAVVFGPEVTGLDTRSVTAELTRNGRPAGEGALTEDPAETLEFVRSFLAGFEADLSPGERVIAGSVVPPLAVAPGDEVEASFGPLGRVSVRFGA